MNSEVLVKFKGDTKDLDTKTKKSEQALKGFSKVIGGGLGTAAGIAATAITTAAVAIGKLTKASVDAYAEFEQLEGGLISLFGEGSAEMNNILKRSENAYKDLTMSQIAYLNSFQTSYPLVNAGLSENADAIEYTNRVLKLSSDLFNTYGGSIEYYQGAINWALKGSFVYLDNLNLGIKGTQEGFIQAANASGILAQEVNNVKDLTNDEIIDVITYYAKAYGVWDKTAQEAGDTILGSLNMVKATWNNFVAGLSKDGADIGKLIDQLVNSALTFADNITPVIIRALEGIAKALPQMATKIGDMLPDLINKLLPPLVQALMNLITSLNKNLPEIIQILFSAVVDISKQMTKMLPEILQTLITVTMAIIDGLALELPNLLPVIVEALMSILPILIDNIPLFIKVGLQLALGILGGLMNATPELIKGSWDLIKSLFKVIATLPTWLVNVGRDVIKGFWNGIKDKTSWVIQKIQGFGNSVLKAIKKIFGVHSPSTEFEWIGKMNMIGFEQGMEEMKNQVQSTIDSVFDLQPSINGQLNSTYSPNMVVNVQNNVEMDPLGQVVNKIKTFSGGAKNDYNWGATQ